MNFWADDTDLDAGQCTALRWDVRNVQAVYLDGEGVPGVSARDVCPGQTTTYTLTATKMDGSQDSRQVTIQVWNAQPPANEWPQIEQFSVSSNEIGLGQCVTFNWRTDNADAVNLLRTGTAVLVSGPTNGSIQDCPQSGGLQEYRLDAYSSMGQVSQTVMVNVLTAQPRASPFRPTLPGGTPTSGKGQASRKGQAAVYSAAASRYSSIISPTLIPSSCCTRRSIGQGSRGRFVSRRSM